MGNSINRQGELVLGEVLGGVSIWGRKSPYLVIFIPSVEPILDPDIDPSPESREFLNQLGFCLLLTTYDIFLACSIELPSLLRSFDKFSDASNWYRSGSGGCSHVAAIARVTTQ